MDAYERGLEALQLLTNTPSSFAALYGFLARDEIEPRSSVDDVFDALTRLELCGWISAWHMTGGGEYVATTETFKHQALMEYRRWLDAPTADLSAEALSLDEVGLWYDIESRGRSALKKLEGSEVVPRARWTLDADSGTRVITIYAEDRISAEAALMIWLETNPGTRLELGTMEINRTSRFSLKDGTTVEHGVCFRIRYSD